MPLRLAVAALLALALLPSAALAAAPSCTAGRTIYAKDGARMYYVLREEAVFGCRRGDRRGKRLIYDDPTYGSFRLLRPVGSIVPFLESTTSEGGGWFNQIGWFDTRTGRHAVGDAFLDEVEMTVLDVAVARDGTTAVVEHVDDEGTIVSVQRLGTRNRLGPARGVAFVRGSYVPRSLRHAGRRVRWRDARGTVAVPRSGEPLSCEAGRTKLAAGPVRVFEVFPARRRNAVLRWCGPGATGVQRLPGPGPRSSELRDALTVSAPDPDGRVAFSAERVAGVADPVAGLVRWVAGVRGYTAVAAVPDGGMAAAYDTPNGRIEGGIVVARPAAAAFRLQRPGLVATYRDPLEAGSLAATADTISWQTRSGPRSVPIGGETAVTCDAGTTLSSSHGVRLFEVLLVSEGRRTLAACRPEGPILLRSQDLADPFPVSLPAVDHGFAAVLLGGDPTTVFTFGTTQESLRSGRIPEDGRSVSMIDLAVAPDGAVAFAYNLFGGRFELQFLAMEPGGSSEARRVAARGGGLRRNSLTVTETEIRWRDAKGNARSVPRP